MLQKQQKSLLKLTKHLKLISFTNTIAEIDDVDNLKI